MSLMGVRQVRADPDPALLIPQFCDLRGCTAASDDMLQLRTWLHRAGCAGALQCDLPYDLLMLLGGPQLTATEPMNG